MSQQESVCSSESLPQSPDLWDNSTASGISSSLEVQEADKFSPCIKKKKMSIPIIFSKCTVNIYISASIIHDRHIFPAVYLLFRAVRLSFLSEFLYFLHSCTPISKIPIIPLKIASVNRRKKMRRSIDG